VSRELSGAVGPNCPNAAVDQIYVAEMLGIVGSPSGGLTSFDDLPPIEEGIISDALANAISNFQSLQSISETIVDPGGETFARLTELVNKQSSSAAPPHSAWLDLAAGVLSLAPLNATGLPSMTFVVSRLVWGPLEAPTFTAQLEATGTVKFTFGSGYPTTVDIQSDLAQALQLLQAGDTDPTFDDISKRTTKFRVSTATQIAGVTDGVSLTFGSDNLPVLGGTLGAGATLVSESFDPNTGAISFAGAVKKTYSCPIGDVQASETVTLQLKLTITPKDFTNGQDESAVLATLAVAAPVVIALAGAIDIAALAEASAEGIRELSTVLIPLTQ
jgi:hypothetical protein